MLSVFAGIASCAISLAPCPQDPQTSSRPAQAAAERQAGERRAQGHSRLLADAPPAAIAVDAALRWLSNHQTERGSWHADGDKSGLRDIGATGLALLAIMGDGNTRTVGPRHENVARGLDWLVAQQDAATGLIGTSASSDFIYGHAIATLALAEACALGGAEEPTRPAAQKAVDYLEKHRNPYSVWRYQPRDNDNDTSVTGWCADALITARDAGLEVPPATFTMVESWLDEMTDPGTGRVGYTKRGGRSSRGIGDHAAQYPPRKSRP